MLLFLKYQRGRNRNIINSKILKQSSIQILKYDLSLRVQWKSSEDTGTVNNPLQFSHSAMPNTLGTHRLQHTRLPCPSPTPGAYSNSCPSSQWCHPTISSSVIPFSSCLQSSPASWSFPVTQFFAFCHQGHVICIYEAINISFIYFSFLTSSKSLMAGSEEELKKPLDQSEVESEKLA